MDESESPASSVVEVLDVLRHRRADGSRPRKRRPQDSVRLALLVEGGGMRGVVSAAMLTALEDLGFKDAFDAVYGCSAGAMNAAYFLSSSETWYFLSIYFDHLASREFVDFARAVRGRDILNLEYAFEEIVTERMPLDLPAVRRSDIPLTVVLSMADTLTPLRVSGFDSDADLREALVATCWLPIARRGMGCFRGRPALDGGVLTPDLAATAREEGFTHMVYLRTRPKTLSARGGIVFRWGMARHLDRLASGLGAAYSKSWSALSSARTPLMPGAVLQVRPAAEADQLARHEIRPEKLLQAARAAYAQAVELFEGPAEQPRAVIPRFVVRGSRTGPASSSVNA